MRSKDQIELEFLYNFCFLNEAKMLDDKSRYIGKMVRVHPVIRVMPDNPEYMKWSVKLEGESVVDVATIHLENVESTINHPQIDRSIRDTTMSKERSGEKRPYILLTGIVKDIDFPISDIQKKISDGSWDSVTYNPHKHPEYVYRNNLPKWWCEDPRLQDRRGEKNFIQNRLTGMKERLQDPEFSKIKVLSKRQGNISSFKAKEAILKQHPVCEEDYMWVKGVI